MTVYNAQRDIFPTKQTARCVKCPEDQWPNKQKTACNQKIITFLSYEDPIGITLTFVAVLFSFISAGDLGIFIKYRDTPIVKANNRELSYFLLIVLIFSFLCCLIFIERPEEWTCFLRQAIFGITFAISVSSLLAKTLIVVIAFNATKPGKECPIFCYPLCCLLTFSMLVFFTVWIFFIPTNLRAKGTATVAVQVFTILASSSGLLGCIFAPKCYVILIKPEQNRKKQLLKKPL